MANPTPACLVHARSYQVALLEGGARTKGRWHRATQVGVIRDRQRLESKREGAGDGLTQVIVIKMELGEAGEGGDGRGDRTGDQVRGEITASK